MAYKRKTWKEKLEDSKNFPKILEFESNFPCAKALLKMGAKPGDSVVIAPPVDVNEIMNDVPAGKLITLNEICRKLAQKHKTKYCCTLTTGIFVTISANAAQETGSGVPYWRTIKNTGELNGKYPGGLDGHKELLEKEGFSVIKKGKKYFVENYEDYLLK